MAGNDYDMDLIPCKGECSRYVMPSAQYCCYPCNANWNDGGPLAIGYEHSRTCDVRHGVIIDLR